MDDRLTAVSSVRRAHLAQQNDKTDKQKQAADIREAAEKFEGYMLRQLFVQMQKAQDSLRPDEGMASDFHRDQFAEHMADVAAGQGGIGVADILEKSWLDHAGLDDLASRPIDSDRDPRFDFDDDEFGDDEFVREPEPAASTEPAEPAKPARYEATELRAVMSNGEVKVYRQPY